jgi:tetratricopeptide (TPR) repeat protein
MKKSRSNRITFAVSLLIGLLGIPVFSDDSFNRLIQAKKYSEAVAYADANIPPGARTADIWVQIGYANEQLKLVEKALASYIVGTRIDPKNYDSYLGIARIYNTMGRPDNVLTYAKKAMELRPTSPGPASWEYAKACIAMKKPEQAKEALEKVIEFDPRNAVANKGLAEIYWKDKEYEKAIPLLKMAYASEPNADDAYKIGKSLNEANKFDSAMYFLKDAVAKNPSFYPAALELAKAYYQKSKYLAAASEYEKIVGKTPFTAMDHFYRAASIEKTGNNEIALKAYRAAAEGFGTEKSPEALTAHLKAGNADLESKNYSAALNHFLCVAAADSEGNQVPDINFLLSDAYNGAGNIPKAIACLEKALSAEKNNVEAYARLADLYQKNGQLDKAKQIFEKCITLKPNDPKIFLVLGEYNLKTKKYDEALNYFGKSYVIENTGSAAAGLAAASFALGKMEKALDAAESALRLSPSLVEPRIVLYKCYYKNKSYREARDQLNFLVDKKPLEIEYWKSLAECCVQLKDSAHCADADKKISEIEKNNIPSRQRLGAYLLATRDYNKALGVYKELSTLTPQNADVFKNLYTITNALGDKQAALGYMKKYCSLRPNDVTAQKYMGGVYYDLKNYDAALEAFRKAIKQEPGVKGIYKQYAQIVISKGLNAEMQTAITGAIASGEADGPMYSALAGFYQKQGLYDKAIAMYQKASELDPRNVSFISALAKCNEKAGHLDEAAIFYGQALALNPSTVEDYKTLGNLFVKRNKKAEATDAYKKYLDKKLDNTAARYVADFAYSQKNYEEASRYYSLINGADAKNPDMLYNFSQSCYNLKNLKKASELLNQLVSITPQNPEAYKLLSMIAAQDENQKNAAANYLMKYLTLKPADAASQKNLGDMFYEQKDTEGALRAYRKAISLDPAIKGIYKRYYELSVSKGSAPDIDAALSGADKTGEVDAAMYIQLGSLSEKKSLFPKALGYYQKAQQLDPSNSLITSSIARCQVKSGNIADAIISYQQVVALNPKAVEEYKILGQLFFKENKPDLAMEEYKRYLAKRPADVEIAMFVAENAFKYNDYTETIKSLSGIQKEKSRDATYLFLLGRSCYYLGKYRNCAETLEQLRALETGGKKIKNLDRGMFLKMLAESYEKTSDKAKAAIVYAEYAQLPDVTKDSDTYFKMAQMQESISPLNAAKMFEKNTLKFPKEYRNYYEAARLYSKQNATYDKAIILIKKCISMRDTVPFLWQVLGKIYGQTGKTAMELDAYRRYIQKETPNPDLCEEIGTSLFKRNKINESIVYLELASALNPENSEFLYQLAKGYEKTNRIADAIPLLKKANQLNPGQEKIQTFLNYLLLKSGGKEN